MTAPSRTKPAPIGKGNEPWWLICLRLAMGGLFVYAGVLKAWDPAAFLQDIESFRLLPYALSRWQIARVNHNDRRPAIFYFHPWEIDPGQPRVREAGAKTRFRHYVNLQHTEGRLRRLLQDFSWGRADTVFRDAA